MSLDSTLDARDEIRLRNKVADIVKKMVKQTHFNELELEELFIIYYKILRDVSKKATLISKTHFASILDISFGMSDNFLLDRIITVLNNNADLPYITMEVWAKTISLFLRGTFDEKIDFCFRVYDVVGDGLIMRDRIIYLLSKFIFKLHEEEVEEAVKDLVEIILKRIDLDKDGLVSLKDFKDSVYKTPLLLECMGKCIPDRDYVHGFFKTFTPIIRKF